MERAINKNHKTLLKINKEPAGRTSSMEPDNKMPI
jgi:hypothetical protein